MYNNAELERGRFAMANSRQKLVTFIRNMWRGVLNLVQWILMIYC